MLPLSPFYFPEDIFDLYKGRVVERIRECPLPLPGHLRIPRKRDELIL